RGGLKWQKEPTDLGVLLSEVTTAFGPQANAAGVRLSVDQLSTLPLVELDPTRIREVLSNLVANALRYTPRGGSVRVTAAAEQSKIRVTVSDNGAGIAAADLPHVFDRFYKSADSRGSGLGLAIAKSLVEAQGGTIEARSDSGKGTAVEFTLPTSTV